MNILIISIIFAITITILVLSFYDNIKTLIDKINNKRYFNTNRYNANYILNLWNGAPHLNNKYIKRSTIFVYHSGSYKTSQWRPISQLVLESKSHINCCYAASIFEYNQIARKIEYLHTQYDQIPKHKINMP